MSIDSFYKKRKYIIKSRINENNRKLKRIVEKELNIECDKKIKEKRPLENTDVELDKRIAEIQWLKAEVADLNGEILENEQTILKGITLTESYVDKNRERKLLGTLIISWIFFIIIFFCFVVMLYFYS